MNRLAVTSAVALFAIAAGASATPVTTYRDTLSVPFTPGSGNSNTNFAISRDVDTGVEVGIKAKERWFGDANVGGTGSLYEVQPGYSPVSGAPLAPLDPPRAWWNFDFSIVLGASDFNNTAVTLGIVSDISGQLLDIDISALMIGAGFGSLHGLQGSENLGFAGLAGPLAFQANQGGDYHFKLTAANNDGVNFAKITVHVVPLPQAAGLGALGLFSLASIRRRR